MSLVICRASPRAGHYGAAQNPQAAYKSVEDADDLFFDGARSRLYVICGQGFVDVLQVVDGAMTELARVATAPGARTSRFAPEQNRLFVAVPQGGGHEAQIRVFEVQN